MFAELDITRENNYLYDGAAIEKVKYFPTCFLNDILWNLIEYPQLLYIFGYSSLQLENFLNGSINFSICFPSL